jgi:beta-lactamase superfamily II metal-dependent hydrolase
VAEQFRIQYYYMGQGDCILIVCPNGQLVMIDCGSAKGLGANNEDLLLKICTDVRARTSKNHNKIDILILTHRDKDHYNQIVQIFSDRTVPQDPNPATNIGVVNIDAVYFSSPPNAAAQYALYKFNQGNCSNHIIGASFKTASITQVFINAAEQKTVTYRSTDSFRLSAGITKQINKRLTLLSGTTPVNHLPWSVSIIAGQVPESNADGDPTNALSLVTLLEIGTSKGLFLGDATQATERFLLAQQKKLIANVDFVHIPHHGSRTSSSPNFVQKVNPKGAEVTHETDECGFKLPKKNVLKRWLDVLGAPKDDTDDHVVDYWDTITKQQFDKILASWKKNGYGITSQDTGFYLTRPPRKYWNSYIYIHQKTNEYWGLYRARTDLNLWGTGATGTTEWTLPL